MPSPRHHRSPTAGARPERPVDTVTGTEALNATEFASVVTAMTSAFGDPTRRDIYLFARAATDGVTAAEVAERFSLHPNVARHHLEKLTAGAYLEVAPSRQERSGAGRPSKRYRATDSPGAVELLTRHDGLLVALLARTLARMDQADAEAIAEEVGADYGRALANRLGDTAAQQRSFRSALHAVADALSAHGFAAHTRDDDGAVRIVAEHCPFGGTAGDNPVICAVDRGLMRGMLASLYGDTTAVAEASVALGDEVCITVVEG